MKLHCNTPVQQLPNRGFNVPLPPHVLRLVGGSLRIGQVAGTDSDGLLLLGERPRSATRNAYAAMRMVA